MSDIDISGFRDIYPFESRYLKINYAQNGPGGELNYHYIDEGESGGAPVVMLHGNPTWSFYYRNLISALKGSHRAVAVDHIGCGLSDKPQKYDYTLENHINNFEYFIESKGLKNITLVVHDWGGAIGMGYAVRHPENIKKIIVMNTAAFRSDFIPLRINICKIPLFGDIAVRGFNAFAKAAVYMATADPAGLSEKVKSGYLAPYNNYHNRIATLRFVEDIPMAPSHPSYKTLIDIENKLTLLKDKPVLVIWGAKDFCFTLEFMKKWKRFFPAADVRNIPHAGHYVLEDARELIIPWVKKFLGD
jgi:haloalkane dehalogenase